MSEGKTNYLQRVMLFLCSGYHTKTTQQRKGHAVGEAVISDSERFYGYNRTRFNQDGKLYSP